MGRNSEGVIDVGGDVQDDDEVDGDKVDGGGFDFCRCSFKLSNNLSISSTS